MHPLYHISPYKLSEVSGTILLKPRIPKMRLPGEDGHTPRVCFSTSINGCLNSISAELLFWGETAWPYYVYSPTAYSPSSCIPAEQLYAKIPDAYATNEVWIIDPVKVKSVGIIRAKTRRAHSITTRATESGTCHFYDYTIEILAGNLLDFIFVSQKTPS